MVLNYRLASSHRCKAFLIFFKNHLTTKITNYNFYKLLAINVL